LLFVLEDAEEAAFLFGDMCHKVVVMFAMSVCVVEPRPSALHVQFAL
jgi:hypothetical protein